MSLLDDKRNQHIQHYKRIRSSLVHLSSFSMQGREGSMGYIQISMSGETWLTCAIKSWVQLGELLWILIEMGSGVRKTSASFSSVGMQYPYHVFHWNLASLVNGQILVKGANVHAPCITYKLHNENTIVKRNVMLLLKNKECVILKLK